MGAGQEAIMLGLSAYEIVAGLAIGIAIMLGVQVLARKWGKRYEK
jgi:hypothetical protein